MVVFQNVSIPPLRLPEVDVEPFDLGGPTKRAAYDLSVSFVVDSGDLLVWVEYDAGLYERGTAERLLTHLESVMRDVAADPAQRLPAGPLWLTDPAEPEEEEGRLPGRSGLALAQERSAALQDQVSARRSRLSDKKLALLKQRLGK
jgi:non-ribosomal peptide synthetase component F